MEALAGKIEIERERAIPVGLAGADLAGHGEDLLPLLFVGRLEDSGELVELAALVGSQHFPHPLDLLVALASLVFQLLERLLLLLLLDAYH